MMRLSPLRTVAGVCCALLGTAAHEAVSSPQTPAVPPAAVSTAPLVRLTTIEAHDFNTSLKALSRLGHITFVAEGRPLKPTLPDAVVKGLSDTPLPFDELTDKLMLLYDYETELKEGGVILLRKQFTGRHDLPDVTVEECRLAAQEMNVLLQQWNPGIFKGALGTDPILCELLGSFSDEQWQQIGAQNLPVSQMSGRQQQLVGLSANLFYVETPQLGLSTAARWLNGLNRKGTVFCHRIEGQKTTFGLEEAQEPSPAYPGYLPPPVFKRLSNFTVTYNGVEQPRGTLPVSHIPLPSDSDAAKQSPPPEENTAAAPVPLLVPPQTLKTVVDTFGARGGTITYRIDAALAAKPVGIAGGELISPDTMMNALSDIYGLRVVTNDNNSLRLLTCQQARYVPRITALPEALQRVLPLPLLRIMCIPEQEKMALKWRTTGPTHEAYEATQRWKQIPTALLFESMWQFQDSFEPKLANSRTGELPLSALNDTENRALANFLMADALKGLRLSLCREVPDYISQPSRVILGGAVPYKDSRGDWRVSLDLLFPSTGGRPPVSQAGASSIRYFGPQ